MKLIQSLSLSFSLQGENVFSVNICVLVRLLFGIDNIGGNITGYVQILGSQPKKKKKLDKCYIRILTIRHWAGLALNRVAQYVCYLHVEDILHVA